MIGTIIVGFVAGLLARAIKPGADSMGWIMTIILGLAGSFIGGILASVLGLSANGGLGGLVLSVAGAVILLFVYEFVQKNRQ